VTKGEEARGGKLAKETIAAMLTISKSKGKEIPSAIGKSQMSRANLKRFRMEK
jgi:hypothetical protein